MAKWGILGQEVSEAVETNYDIAMGIVREYIKHFKDEGHQATVVKLKKLIEDIEEAIKDKPDTLDPIANDREMW